MNSNELPPKSAKHRKERTATHTDDKSVEHKTKNNKQPIKRTLDNTQQTMRHSKRAGSQLSDDAIPNTKTLKQHKLLGQHNDHSAHLDSSNTRVKQTNRDNDKELSKTDSRSNKQKTQDDSIKPLKKNKTDDDTKHIKKIKTVDNSKESIANDKKESVANNKKDNSKDSSVNTKKDKVRGGKQELNKKNKPLLVMDLDETLIRSVYQGGKDADLLLTSSQGDIEFGVYFRNGLLQFLETLYNENKFDLAVFTAATEEYGRSIIDGISEKLRERGVDLSKRPLFVSARFRQHLGNEGNKRFKPLSEFTKEGYSVDNILLIDDLRSNLYANKENGIFIKPFDNIKQREKDQELISLLLYLQQLNPKWKMCKQNTFILQ